MIYTRRDIQRIATEKAMEILRNEKDMLLTNTSFGVSRGECLVGLSNDSGLRGTRNIIIALEYIRETWDDERCKFVVFEEINNVRKEIEVIDMLYTLHSKNNLYTNEKEAYDKSINRMMRRWDRKRSIKFDIKMGTSLNANLKARIEKETGKRIKKQDMKAIRSKNGYIVYYMYRGNPTEMIIKFK